MSENNEEQLKSVPENMVYWEQLKSVPENRLKTIQAGRLKGKSDINPQWRYEALTSIFGPCGFGWKFTIDKLWTEPGPIDQVFAFALISLYYRQDNEWSDPIPGQGGSMLIVKESSGLHASDEGYKMAITDALGTAAKMIGVAADIYSGNYDGSKYKEPDKDSNKGSNTKVSTDLPWLNPKTEEWDKCVVFFASEKSKNPALTDIQMIGAVKKKFRISKEKESQLLTEIGQKILTT